MLIIPDAVTETSYSKQKNNIDQNPEFIISEQSIEYLSENIETEKDDEIISVEVIKQTFVDKVIQQNNIGRTNINTSNEIIPWAVRYPKRSKDIIINQKILKKTISIIQDEKSMKIVL